MKKIKIILTFLIVATAVISAVNIFNDNAVKVKTDTVKLEDYAPYLIFSGSIASSVTDEKDYAQALADNAYVSVLVGESNISSIKKGQKAEVTGSGFIGKYSAEVITVGKTARKISTTAGKIVVVDVVLKIDEPDDSIKSGFTAKVKIFTDENEKVLTIPYSAVMQHNNTEYVFVLENGRAVKRNVKTGREFANGCEVLSGISEGESVITSPADLKDGTKVILDGGN